MQEKRTPVVPGKRFVLADDGEQIDTQDRVEGFHCSLRSREGTHWVFKETRKELEQTVRYLARERGWRITTGPRPVTLCKGNRGGLYELHPL